MLLKSKAKGSTMTKGPYFGVSTHLMTNITECYGKVWALSKSITDLLFEGQYVDWKHFDIKRWSSKRDSVKGCVEHNQRHQGHRPYDYLLSGHWQGTICSVDIGKGVIC